jgi:thymidylate synthase (FAD)
MVEIISHFGNDLMVANVARVSFGKEVDEFTNRDQKLLHYLSEHKHTSPFRHPHIQFRITCSIYVERQIFKHQTGISVNSISGRYVDFSDSYTIIREWRKQSKSSKQGSEGLIEYQVDASKIEDDVIKACKAAYNSLLNMGVSKEQARSVLPLSLNTTFIWTGSLLALFHLFNLRIKPDAQVETREIADEMLRLVENIEGNPFKGCLKAFDMKSSKIN